MRISGQINDGFGTIHVSFSDVGGAVSTTASTATVSVGAAGEPYIVNHPHTHSEFVLSDRPRTVQVGDGGHFHALTPLDAVLAGGAILCPVAAFAVRRRSE